MHKNKFRLPRLMWIRKPITQVVPNKKAKISKEACRKWQQERNFDEEY